MTENIIHGQKEIGEQNYATRKTKVKKCTEQKGFDLKNLNVFKKGLTFY